MEDLKTTKVMVKRRSSDVAMLRALAADLNNPVLTGAGMTPEQNQQNEEILATEFAKAAQAEAIPEEAQNQTVAPPVTTPVAYEPAREKPARLFLTGVPGTGIVSLISGADAHVFNLWSIVNEVLKKTCQLNGNPSPAVLNEFRKFGDGEFLPSLANILHLGFIRLTQPLFSTPSFWSNTVLTALEHDVSGKQAIVVGVRTSSESKALLAAGFSHYHVMCSPATAAQRAGAEETLSQLAVSLGAEVQQKISVQRNGPRLNVVWTDANPAPSTRFISEADFKREILGVAEKPRESDMSNQIL